MLLDAATGTTFDGWRPGAPASTNRLSPTVAAPVSHLLRSEGRRVQLGIMTPILSWRAGAPDWVQQGGIDDVAEIVSAAERLGYAFCTCSEHAALTRAERERRSRAYWDPLASFSYLAARTSSIRLLTWLVVLGYHHPVALAKRYGQLDLMSNGRLVLGVGVGTLKEEFALLGAPFEDRGPRADDAIRAIRAIWGQPWATYAGTHYDFADWWVMPHAPANQAADPGWRPYPALVATGHRARGRLGAVCSQPGSDRGDAGLGTHP